MKSSKRIAGSEVDTGTEGEFSTADLPLSGHDTAIDDGQQQYSSREASILYATSKEVGDKAIARRLRLVANKVEAAFKKAASGISEYSTASLPESGNDDDLSGPAIDVDQVGSVLQDYGTNPPKKGEAGPEPRTAAKDSSLVNVIYSNYEDLSKTQDVEELKNKIIALIQPLVGKGVSQKYYSNLLRNLELSSEKGKDNLLYYITNAALNGDGMGTNYYKSSVELSKIAKSIVKTIYRSFVAAMNKKNSTKLASVWADLGMTGADPTEPPPMGQEGQWPTYQNYAVGVLKKAMANWQSQGDWKKLQVAAGMISDIQSQYNNSQSAARSKNSQNVAASSGIRSASVETEQEPWEVFKKELSRVASRGGSYGNGSWNSTVDRIGKSVDLDINTNLVDGSPYTQSKVSFSLLKYDKKSKKATVEILDNALNHERRKVTFSTKSAAKLAETWAKNSEDVAKSYLEND